MRYRFSVFTKPWKQQTADQLAELVRNFGFDGVEFPLRPGYQAQPEDADVSLPKLSAALAARGLSIMSVASGTTERIFAACQACGVPVIRIMCGFDRAQGYLAGEEKARRELEALQPLCAKYGVKVGVQQHFGYMVSNSMEMRHLVEGLDPSLIGLVWDSAHSGLAGEDPEQALDIAWDYLCLVNFKAAFYRRENGPEAAEARWTPYFTEGRHGISPWSTAVNYLVKRGYQGDVCMPAEYTAEGAVQMESTARDLCYLKSLFDAAARGNGVS